jgi:hypothetical protein
MGNLEHRNSGNGKFGEWRIWGMADPRNGRAAKWVIWGKNRRNAEPEECGNPGMGNLGNEDSEMRNLGNG